MVLCLEIQLFFARRFCKNQRVAFYKLLMLNEYCCETWMTIFECLGVKRVQGRKINLINF